MQIIKINYQNSEMPPVQEAIGVLNRGGAVIFPTDTVYGLAVNALRLDAVERLFKIKKRPAAKAVPIIIKDIEMAKKFAFIDKRIEKVLRQVWPGPVTVVLEKRKDISEFLTGHRKTIGLRIPDCAITKILMDNLDYPITATSANLSGDSSLIHSIDIVRVFEKAHPRPNLFLDAGDLENVSPSTVLDLTGSKPKILRVGPVNKEQLMKMFK